MKMADSGGIPGWYLMLFGTIVAGGWLVTVIATAVANREPSAYVHAIMGIVATALFGVGFARSWNGARSGPESRMPSSPAEEERPA